MQNDAENLLYDGCLHSPFFIFIRRPHPYSDFELLTRFHLGSYRHSATASRFGRHAIMAEAGSWTMLADDWFYTLWHMESTRPVIEGFADCHELFTCSEGDCDRSFDYAHYQGGRLRRNYVVSSPHFSDRVVVKDVGLPLPEEIDLLRDDGINIGLEVADRIGIKTRFKLEDLRIYEPNTP